MPVKKIIPCLDVKDGKVVKGVHFENVKVAGDVIENALFYSKEGADEIVFLDISASVEGRKTMVPLVKEVAKVVSIPLIVGGGIKNLLDIEELISAGVKKVSINTAVIKDHSLIQKASKKFGKEAIIVAIDAKLQTTEDRRQKSPREIQRISGTKSSETWKDSRGENKKNPPSAPCSLSPDKRWEVYIGAGRVPTGMDAVKWAKEAEGLGAGALLPTSIDKDGTKAGYDIELTRSIKEAVKIPVIASGGAGTLEHIYEVLTKGKADAALCASIFHFRNYSIKEAKEYLKKRGVEVKI
ncbi:MAG: imidazole glycerol phosphate synthase subunit HisF [Candidatus Ratteibacteria bacterium]|nr:imidazole glycerol phosphate synthase subunit HisF [Candidatus Ratteibacteria bacterium]